MFQRLAIRVLTGPCRDPQGRFHRRSQAWNLRQRLSNDLPAWGYPDIARQLGYRDARAAAVDVALHEIYMLQSTDEEIRRRQAGYMLVPAADDPHAIDVVEIEDDK